MSKYAVDVVCAYTKGYRASIEGYVISPFTGKLLKLMIDSTGYYRFSIRNDDNKIIKIAVHKLVAYQKYGNNSVGDNIHIRHLNGNPLDNRDSNISIGSISDNMLDVNVDIRVEKSLNASTLIRKFSDIIVNEIKYKRSLGYTYKRLMDEYDISSKGTLWFILKNDYKTKVLDIHVVS